MKKSVKIIIFIVVIVLIAGGVFTYKYVNRIRFNDTYVNGNLSGNLYNDGIFCESFGQVFFSNPDDNGALYSMNLDGSEVKKLSEDTAMSINADRHYVYYVRNNDNSSSDYSFFAYNNNALCRIPRKGGKVAILDKDICSHATLVGNYIYYIHSDSKTASTFYRIRIDGKERTQLDNTYVFPCCALNQYLFFSGSEDGNIYQYDCETNTKTEYYACDSYNPIVTGDNNIFYLDIKRNNALIHTNANFDNPIIISDESIDSFNVYGSNIYYQVTDNYDNRLCMIKNDGSEKTIIAHGNFNGISVTSYFIYFREFESGNIYYTPTGNPGALVPFHPGKES